MIDNFQSIGVCADTRKALARMNITQATPVQRQVIRPFLEGKDLIVEAPTGTGKTCAFSIPIVQMTEGGAQTPQALVLCPTRELAIQTTAVFRQLLRSTPGIRVASIYGGESIGRQFAALRQRPHIVVATPGRLVDHLGRRSIDLGAVRTVVLDEADRMLDMGFAHDLNRILETIPNTRQTVLLSATMSKQVKDIAKKYQHMPQSIRITPETKPVDAIQQYFAKVQTSRKNEDLYTLLEAKQYPLALVFVRTKRKAAALSLMLEKKGLCSGALHGNMSQSQRDRVMEDFRRGRINVLVATDIAARGIDVRKIDAVINLDLPDDSDAYTHRIGRTGRADHRGIALTFVEGAEEGKISQIARNRNIEFIPGNSLASAI